MMQQRRKLDKASSSQGRQEKQKGNALPMTRRSSSSEKKSTPFHPQLMLLSSKTGSSSFCRFQTFDSTEDGNVFERWLSRTLVSFGSLKVVKNSINFWRFCTLLSFAFWSVLHHGGPLNTKWEAERQERFLSQRTRKLQKAIKTRKGPYAYAQRNASLRVRADRASRRSTVLYSTVPASTDMKQLRVRLRVLLRICGTMLATHQPAAR